MPPRPFPLPINVGTDICSVQRIYHIIANGRPEYAARFVKKILTDRESEAKWPAGSMAAPFQHWWSMKKRLRDLDAGHELHKYKKLRLSVPESSFRGFTFSEGPPILGPGASILERDETPAGSNAVADGGAFDMTRIDYSFAAVNASVPMQNRSRRTAAEKQQSEIISTASLLEATENIEDLHPEMEDMAQFLAGR